MNAVYTLVNLLVGAGTLVAAAGAAYITVPELWTLLDATCVSAFSVVLLIGVLVVGFLTLEARKV